MMGCLVFLEDAILDRLRKPKRRFLGRADLPLPGYVSTCGMAAEGGTFLQKRKMKEQTWKEKARRGERQKVKRRRGHS